MTEYVIETRGLTVHYGPHRGILDVDLRVEKGEVFGFLGPNGAGKTTMERVLLDIIRPSAGTATLFQRLDSQKDGVEARRRIGYLPGELALYADMSAAEFFRMYHSLRGGDAQSSHWRELAERLGLDTSREIRHFSRGNKQKVGIVTAFMNRPELLILDEPTGGLDPLVQQTVIEMVREARQEGATVFFSSHILPEVQAVADRVGIIRNGQLVAIKRVEEMIAQHFKRMHLSFTRAVPADAFALDGVREVERTTKSGQAGGQTISLEVRGGLQALLEVALRYDIQGLETESVSLEDVFLAYYDGSDGGNESTTDKSEQGHA